jgi:type IV pilus assembly protein PilC
MVESGLSLARALGILSEQIEHAELRRVFSAVRMDVESGSAFSAALRKHPKVFPNLYVTMVQAGEIGGNLDKVLMSVADTLERQVDLRHKIRFAFSYPVVVFIIMIIIFVVMMTAIVPIFEKLFNTLHGVLPLPTRIVIAISRVLLSIWVLAVIAVIVAGVVALRRWIKTEKGRAIWDQWMLKPPIFGPLVQKVTLARFSSTLSSLLSAGVPMLESLDIVSETAGNRTVADAIQDSKQGVREGRSLAQELERHAVMPALVTQMVQVGEQTGALDAMLQKVADFYNNEVDATVNSLTSILQPILTVIIGLFVGAMVVSLYMPMFEYVKYVH